MTWQMLAQVMVRGLAILGTILALNAAVTAVNYITNR